MRYASTIKVIEAISQQIESPTLPPISPNNTKRKSLNQQLVRHKDCTGCDDVKIAPAPRNAIAEIIHNPHLSTLCMRISLNSNYRDPWVSILINGYLMHMAGIWRPFLFFSFYISILMINIEMRLHFKCILDEDAINRKFRVI
jgi:hypothetical protein